MEKIIKEYVDSEVTSGEFIYNLEFSKDQDKETVRESVQEFLDWDESPETFDVVDGGDKWVIK